MNARGTFPVGGNNSLTDDDWSATSDSDVDFGPYRNGIRHGGGGGGDDDDGNKFDDHLHGDDDDVPTVRLRASPTQAVKTFGWPQRKEGFVPNKPHPALECPPLYFALRRSPLLLRLSRTFYRFRWRLAYPLQRRIWFSRHLRKLGIFLTWGELLLLIPFALAVLLGIGSAVVARDVSMSGHAARVPLLLAFLTAQRNSFLTLVFGIPVEKILPYHKLAARVAYLNGLLHTFAAFVPPSVPVVSPPGFFDFLGRDSVNISGTAMLLLMTGMAVAALPWIRRTLFEVFYYVHVVFAATTVVCASFHSGVLVPILVAVLWGGDLLLRKLIMACLRYPRTATLRVISDTVLEVSFLKTDGFDYNPGQYVYLSVPRIGLLEWHPFSLSSSPCQKFVTLHIRTCGDWTKRLYALAKEKENREIGILLEGPYGSVGVDLISYRYKMVMLFSGGIGVTPMQSICSHLMVEQASGLRSLKRLKFIWVERDPVVMEEQVNDVVEHSSRFTRIRLTRGESGDDLGNASVAPPPSVSASTSAPSVGASAASTASTTQGVCIPATPDRHGSSSAAKPDEIASSLLAMVPPSATTDAQLEDEYPSHEFMDLDDCLEEDEEEEMEEVEGPEERGNDASTVWLQVSPTSAGGPPKRGGDDDDGGGGDDDDGGGDGDVEIVAVDLESGEATHQFGEIRETFSFREENSSESEAESPPPPTTTPTTTMTTPQRATTPESSSSSGNSCSVNSNSNINSTPDFVYDALDLQVYLTGDNAAHQEALAVASPFVHYGRPDVKALFQQMKKEAMSKGEKRVAVCVCAPQRLVRICQKACVKYSDGRVRFDFHDDGFQ